MPRKGWSAVEVPNGWLQVIRGPRLPAAQWPRAKAQSKPVQKPNPKVGQPPVVQPPQTESHERQRRSPAEVRAMATSNIGRIRATITSLGPDDTEERVSLEAALVRAEHLASSLPYTSGSRTQMHSSFGRRSVSQQNPPRLSRPNSREKSSSRSWHRRRKI